jgi:hypothetical protein
MTSIDQFRLGVQRRTTRSSFSAIAFTNGRASSQSGGPDIRSISPDTNRVRSILGSSSFFGDFARRYKVAVDS